MKEYHSLDALQQEIKNGTFQLPSVSLRDMGEALSVLDLTERVDGFHLMIEHALGIVTENLDALRWREQKEIEKGNQELAEILQKSAYLFEEQKKMVQQWLDGVNQLISLKNENKQMPVRVNGVYEVSDWNHAFHDHTGEGCGDIHSSKAKVIENSAFKNAYYSFMLKKKRVKEPVVAVKVSYGSYKGCVVFLPLRQLKGVGV